MNTYVIKIASSKGIPLEYLSKEIQMIIDKHLEGDTIINLVPALDCIWLRSDNHKLKSALQRDSDFIVST